MKKMTGELFAFFPTPYPDETLYSVMCRFRFRCGAPTYRYFCEKLFGRRLALNSDIPFYIPSLTLQLPKNTGLTIDYFIRQTTLFPYFAPFLKQTRKSTFLEYLQKDPQLRQNTFINLGTSRLRQPKDLHLRFCESCWQEDIQTWGEPYWHRTHQLPGVMMCHRHGEPLQNSPVLNTAAQKDLYAASTTFISQSTVCGSFRSNTAEKLMALSENSQWLLENGHRYGPYEQVFPKYDLWLRIAGYASLIGQAWHNKIYDAVQELYGEDFLRLVDAYDEDVTITWSKRILFYPQKLQHPLYHILFHILLAGSSDEFFEDDCKKPLPYGEGPWPCRNRICPYHLKDVIEKIEIRYERGMHRTLFLCPHCGFAYRRKHPIPKEEQYSGYVYIADYGHLWRQKLREYMVEQGLSARKTCEILQCDMYTVQKYGLQLGFMASEDATNYERKKPPCPIKDNPPVLSKDQIREKWKQLIQDYPTANRSLLSTLDYRSYGWLRKNDLEWFEENSPPARYATHFDWESRDMEVIKKAQETVYLMHNTTGRPIRITKFGIAQYSGLEMIKSNRTLKHMPLTTAYLAEHLETMEQWRKRKIVWAIQVLRERGDIITLYKIGLTACIDRNIAAGMYDFMQESLEQAEQS